MHRGTRGSRNASRRKGAHTKMGRWIRVSRAKIGNEEEPLERGLRGGLILLSVHLIDEMGSSQGGVLKDQDGKRRSGHGFLVDGQ